MKKIIVVTGAAGFIGTNLVLELNKQGVENILTADFLDDSIKWKNLSEQRFLEYVEADKLMNVLVNYDVQCIFHLGACSNTRENDGKYLIENNYQYSIDLAKFAIKNKIRFIYASSAATYGLGENGYIDNHLEIDMLRPLNMYGYSKQLFDQWLLRNDCLDKVVGLKYFNIYGPHENHKGDMRSVVKKAYEEIKESSKVSLFKSYKKEYLDGEQKRDFLYVKEAVKMTDFFRLNKIHTGIFNIGLGEEHSWNELVTAIFEALDLDVKIKYIEMPEDLRKQYQYFTKAEMAKLRGVGYKNPIYSFKESISDYVLNYLEKE
jgi:ADP-L-glycero-D-manno-heptose 6-epimerase